MRGKKKRDDSRVGETQANGKYAKCKRVFPSEIEKIMMNRFKSEKREYHTLDQHIFFCHSYFSVGFASFFSSTKEHESLEFSAELQRMWKPSVATWFFV